MRITVYCGDITQVPADAVCSSTNPHLELVAGSGAALREAGGWDIQEECRALIEAEFKATGHRFMDVGTVHWTTAGTLPYKGLIHAVAIDPFHHSGIETVQKCTANALELCRSKQVAKVAMPVYASRYGDIKLEDGLRAMLEVLDRYDQELPSEVVIVVRDEDREQRAKKVIEGRQRSS